MEFWNAVYMGMSISFGILAVSGYAAAKAYIAYRTYMLMQSISDDAKFIRARMDSGLQPPVVLGGYSSYEASAEEVQQDSASEMPKAPADIYAFLTNEYIKQGYPPSLAGEMATEAMNNELNSMKTMVTE